MAKKKNQDGGRQPNKNGQPGGPGEKRKGKPAAKAAAVKAQPKPLGAFEGIVGGLIVLTFLAGSFAVTKTSLESFRTPQQAALGVGIFLIFPAWFAWLFFERGLKIRIPAIWPSLAGLTAVSFVSIFLAEIKQISIHEFIFYLEVVFLFFFVYQLIGSRGWVHFFIGVVIFIGWVTALGAVGQYFFDLNARLLHYEGFYDPFSTFGNKNYLCEYLAMILPMTIAMMLHSRRLEAKAFFFASAALFTLVVLITQTRGGWVGLAVGSLFIFGVLLAEKNGRHLKQLTALGGVLIFSVMVIVFMQGRGILFNRSQIPFMKRFLSIGNIHDDSIKARTIIWGASWLMFKENPIGIGVGAYKTRYLRHLKDYLREAGIDKLPTGEFKDINAKEAHNEYFNALIELGPLGLLAIVALIVQMFMIYRNLHKRLNDPFDRMAALGAVASLISVGVAAIVGFPFHIVATAMSAGALLAILMHYSDAAAEKTLEVRAGLFKDPIVKALAFAAAAATFFYGARFSLDPWFASVDIKIANQCRPLAEQVSEKGRPAHFGSTNICIPAAMSLDEINAMDSAHQAEAILTRVEDLYKRSMKRDPYNGEIHTFYGTFLAQYRKKYEEAIQELLLARKYYNLPEIHLHLGLIYYQTQQLDKAEAEYKEVLGLFPTDHRARYFLGMIAESKNQLQTALTYYQEAISVAENDAKKQYYFKVARLLQKLGNTEQSMKAYQDIVDKFPNDINSLYNLGVIFSVELKDWERAKGLYGKVLEIDPNYCPARNNLGRIYLEEGNMDEAILNFQTCLAANPNYDEAISNLAAALYRQGRYQETVEKIADLLKRNVSADSRFKGYFNMAMAYLALKDPDNALKAFESAKKVQPQTKLEPIHGLRCSLEMANIASARQQWGACYDYLKEAQADPALLMRSSTDANMDVEMRTRFGQCAFNSLQFEDAFKALNYACGRVGGPQSGAQVCKQAELAKQRMQGGAQPANP